MERELRAAGVSLDGCRRPARPCTLGGPYAVAADVSADGKVVVGQSWDANSNSHAFRWTAATGMQDLGTFGGFDSGAYGVSADGSVIVGMAYDPGNWPHAFRWTAATGLQFIGTLSAGGTSEAFSVSADGQVIVGRSDGGAFRWTAATGMQNLGTLGGIGAAAFDVSSNGSVIVGESSNASGTLRAFKWTAATGMKDLSTIYAGSIGSGSYLQYANAVSADGLRITGYGYNRSAGRYSGYLTP